MVDVLTPAMRVLVIRTVCTIEHDYCNVLPRSQAYYSSRPCFGSYQLRVLQGNVVPVFGSVHWSMLYVHFFPERSMCRAPGRYTVW